MSRSDAILQRISHALGEGALERLRALPPRDLQSLLLHLCADRAADAAPHALLTRWQETPLFQLAYVDPRLSLRFAAAAFEAAQAFEAVELSPVGPLGAIHSLSGIHQNNVLSALRGAELVADPTPLLALECARRRRTDRAQPTRLCTSQRLLRMQPTPKGLLPHFRLFGMVTAARGDDLAHLREHLAVYLQLLTTLPGFRFDQLTVSVSHTGAIAARLAAAGIALEDVRAQVRTEVWSDPDALLAARGLQPMRGRAAALDLPPRYAAVLRALDGDVLAPLAQAFPAARVQLDLGRLEGLGYYVGPCVRVTARDREGMMLPLTDGGFVDWTQRLLNDKRERFLITGIGSDLACARFQS